MRVCVHAAHRCCGGLPWLSAKRLNCSVWVGLQTTHIGGWCCGWCTAGVCMGCVLLRRDNAVALQLQRDALALDDDGGGAQHWNNLGVTHARLQELKNGVQPHPSLRAALQARGGVFGVGRRRCCGSHAFTGILVCALGRHGWLLGWLAAQVRRHARPLWRGPLRSARTCRGATRARHRRW